MVLAQLFSNRLVRLPYFQVSIPQWFSLNNEEAYEKLDKMKFPSHNGSRSTMPFFQTLVYLHSFHPTLVLAQLE